MTVFACAGLLCLPVKGLSGQQSDLSPQPQNAFPGCGAVEQSSAARVCQRVSFDGEVALAKSFSREFGEGLTFRLNPGASNGGWSIEVVRDSTASDAYREFVWVVTPPYRYFNPRYVDTSYGTSARESVAMTPREFNFVLSDKQYEMAANLVDLAIMSRPQSDQRSPEKIEKESQDAAAALMKFSVAKGRLWILDSKTKKASNDLDPGTIEWIKFRVELYVPCGFRVLPNATELSVDSSACAAAKGASAN